LGLPNSIFEDENLPTKLQKDSKYHPFLFDNKSLRSNKFFSKKKRILGMKTLFMNHLCFPIWAEKENTEYLTLMETTYNFPQLGRNNRQFVPLA
jgi:hypothetical protein